MGAWRESSYASLTLALDGGDLSGSRSSRFTPGDIVMFSPWVGSWLGAILSRSRQCEHEKKLVPAGNRAPISPVVQPVV
jgi:hypothetical protein